MKNKPTFDQYISNSEEFARPILNYIRELIHDTCPVIEEEIKWNFPCFIYKGSILADMAGFKQHATLGFWLSSKMTDPQGVFVRGENKGMGNFGRITSIDDLPNKELLKSYIREAISLHDQGLKVSPRGNKTPIPKNLALFDSLKLNKSALLHFKKFTPSQKGEYHKWANDAKTQATRDKRIAQSLEWISEGKPRNWKYMKSWLGKS